MNIIQMINLVLNFYIKETILCFVLRKFETTIHILQKVQFYRRVIRLLLLFNNTLGLLIIILAQIFFKSLIDHIHILLIVPYFHFDQYIYETIFFITLYDLWIFKTVTCNSLVYCYARAPRHFESSTFWVDPPELMD